MKITIDVHTQGELTNDQVETIINRVAFRIGKEQLHFVTENTAFELVGQYNNKIATITVEV